MLKSLVLLLFLFFNSGPYTNHYRVVARETGVATAYYPGDGHSSTTCADGKPFTADRCHVAHRKDGLWQLGKPVRVCSMRTKLCTLSYIGDTGPFGACEFGLMPGSKWHCNGRHFVKVRTRTGWKTRALTRDGKGWTHHTTDPGGTYRGVLDMSRCVRDKISGKRRGIQMVTVELLKRRNGWQRIRRFATGITVHKMRSSVAWINHSAVHTVTVVRDVLTRLGTQRGFAQVLRAFLTI